MADTRRLPPPVSSVWDWQRLGACRGMDSEVYFAESERGKLRSRHEDQAKQVCRRCPVIEECRRHALSVQEPYGVWGGLTVDERAVLLGRPRRSDRPSH